MAKAAEGAFKSLFNANHDCHAVSEPVGSPPVPHSMKSALAALAVAALFTTPAPADPLGHGANAVGATAGRVWQSLTGFRPATVNGLVLYSGSASGPNRIATVGEVASTDRWRCAANVGGARLYSTGMTETAARAKLLPYTNTRFRCERHDYNSLFD